MAKYSNLPKDLKQCTRDDINRFILATEKAFPRELFGEGTDIALDKPYFDGTHTWSSTKEFFVYITDLTGTSDIRSASNVLYQTVTKTPEFTTTMTPAPKAAVESNTLSPQQLEQFAKEDQAKRVIYQKSVSDAKIQVETAIKKKQENWEKLQEQKLPKVPPKEIQNKVITELAGKVLYAVPDKKAPEVTLTKQEEDFVKIAKADPKLFAKKLTTLIIEKNPDIPKDILEPLSQVVAVDATKSLSNPIDKPVPTGVFAALSEAPSQIENLSSLTQTELAKTTSILTVSAEKRESIYRVMLLRSVGENITNKILGPPETTYHLSTSEAEGSHSLKVDQLQSNSFNLQQGPVSGVLDSPLLSESKSLATREINKLALSKLQSLPNQGFLGNISRLTNSQAFDSIAPFLGMQTQASYVGTSFFGNVITKFLPEYAPLISNIAGKLGFDIGISAIAPVATETATNVGGTITKGAVSKGLMAVATKVGLGTTITAIGQALGSFAPIVGNLIAFVATTVIAKIAEKINWAKVKEWGAAIIGISSGLIALPFLGTGAAIVIGGAATAVSAGLGAGLGRATLGGVAAGIGGFFATLGKAFIGAVGTPILVTLLAFPVVVALFLFIINSGAYIVPPLSSSIYQENPYISVEKTATPRSAENSELPLTVDYVVTITAKKSPLSNVRITDKCTVSRKGSIPPCPDSSVNIPTTEEIDTISPSKSFSYDYTVTYSGNLFTDSLVANSVTVVADTPESKNETTSGSASVMIGEPPFACLEVTGQWPDKARMESVVATLSSTHPTYMSKVCSSNETIFVTYSRNCPATGRICGGYYPGGNSIIITDFGLIYGDNYTLFTLAHETAHYFDSETVIGDGLFSRYKGTISPPDICSYDMTEPSENPGGAYSESFAETIGRYASNQTDHCFDGSFKDKYPTLWQFANDNIFK